MLILASASPRRASYLADAGIAFLVVAAEIPEIPSAEESAADYALRVASDKAKAVAARYPDHWVLAADTDVVLDGAILGKPQTADRAHAMLQALSGRRHEVISAVVLRRNQAQFHCVTRSGVVFRSLSTEEITRYVASGEPLDKAGGYGIQGAAAGFVRSIDGSYTGIVGLPMAETLELLRSVGIPSP